MPAALQSAKSPRSAQDAKANRIANIHILILISSDRAGNLVKRLFQNLGFTHLYIAYHAVEGLQFLRDKQIHFIVTDADLKIADSIHANNRVPKGYDSFQLSGIQFVHRLRYSAASPAPFIPILMLMDHARSEDVTKARDVGVNEIVLKPLEALNFCERIIAMVDNPKPHITASTYRGPCRRRTNGTPPSGEERRIREIRLVRCNEIHGAKA